MILICKLSLMSLLDWTDVGLTLSSYDSEAVRTMFVVSFIVWTYLPSLAIVVILLSFYAGTYSDLPGAATNDSTLLSWQRNLQKLLNDLPWIIFWQGRSVRNEIGKRLPDLEAREPYRSAAELLDFLYAVSGSPNTVSEAQSISMAIYRLEDFLSNITPAMTMSAVLEAYSATLVNQKIGGLTIERAEKVDRGALVDRKTMLPTSSGSRVTRPLGLILTSSGTVISKAKVRCS